MKKILPLLLLAGGGFIAYQYFKKKDDQKDDIADKMPIEPDLEKSPDVQDETGSTVMPTQENPLNTAIKIVAPIVKQQTQKITAKIKAKRAKKKSKVIIEPLQSSNVPFAPIPKKVKRVKAKKVKTKRVKKQRTKKVGFTDDMVLF